MKYSEKHVKVGSIWKGNEEHSMRPYNIIITNLVTHVETDITTVHYSYYGEATTNYIYFLAIDDFLLSFEPADPLAILEEDIRKMRERC